MSGKRKILEHLSRMTAYSCMYDPRFIYFVYVPRNWLSSRRPERYNLAVLVHGSERAAESYRNNFIAFAEHTNTVVLAPLFPAGLINPDKIENYNFLRFEDIFFDVVLLKMIDEVNTRFPVNTDNIHLHGFSAGGQFVHRFMYVYPERLACVSIGAPGNVTFLDANMEWPAGIGGMEKPFGRTPDFDILRRIPVQIVVGGADTRIDDPATPHNRVELNQALFHNYQENGMNVRFSIVPGVGHDGLKVLPEVIPFFQEVMEMHLE